MDLMDSTNAEEDERKLKNLATRIMSNGVEVLVKDKNPEQVKPEQRRIKHIHLPQLKSTHKIQSPKKSLLSSAVATVINHHQMSALYPLQKYMQHNYIIKTCLTTFTYLTTVVHNKRSAISTFETIVSVVSTESLTNLFATDLMPDIKPTRTKFMEVKTLQPSAVNSIFKSQLPKLEKRVDDIHEDVQINFDLIQPSEPSHTPCTTHCSCSHSKTEGLKTKYDHPSNNLPPKATKFGATKLELRPTKQKLEKQTQYAPYEYESNSQGAPTDRIVEKYTEVISDYSDEKDSGSVEESELLTNEQAPGPPKQNKVTTTKPEKVKPEKVQKPNKNKFVVADLLKLGSLGIKGLSQLAPVIEKMTGGFIKRHEVNKTTTTTTEKSLSKLTPYNVDKRIDSDFADTKQSSFPIYIPVDEMETSESQTIYTNATLHQNLAWGDHKHPKSHHIFPPKMVHESPLVNGGIPISPGEIITANSDVIVGKPAVGGPLTLAASGIKLHNPVNPPILDSYAAGNEQYIAKEKPFSDQVQHQSNVDDSYDLRPPDIPKSKSKHPNRPPRQPPKSHHPYHPSYQNKNPTRPLVHNTHVNEQVMKTEQMKGISMLGNHGRPAFLDYIPSLDKTTSVSPPRINDEYNQSSNTENEPEVPDNNPSSSEIVSTRVDPNGDSVSPNLNNNKPFLVDIQPSKVANVLIPHGSSTALVFAGSSEPHKTGDYIDDPLPYPEPGYFGSFSIDAPQMTNVHTSSTNIKPYQVKPNNSPQESYKLNGPFKDGDHYRHEYKQKWKESKRPADFNRLPPPTSNQESHVQVGPQITVYNPDIYKPNTNGELEKYNHYKGNDKYNKDGKEIIDKEYENYLAVPPPPPSSKMHYHHEPTHEKNKFSSQKPIVHMKPIQDMKVFLNIQHPTPKPHYFMNQDKLPPKVTSEIYFAAQAPNNKQTPTYTIHLPPTPNPYQNNYNNQATRVQNVQSSAISHVFHSQNNAEPFSNAVSSKPNFLNEVSSKDDIYTVTLNTAANVASHVGESGQIVGSSIPVSVGQTNNINTHIPISTNFEIKVEDGPSYLSTQNDNRPSVPYNEHDQVSSDKNNENNRWNVSSVTEQREDVSLSHTENYSQIPVSSEKTRTSNAYESEPQIISVNSHANFPMVHQHSTSANINEDNIKPVTEIVDESRPEQKRPAKFVPNIQTNSHGWYSNAPINELKIEATTRKNIPLLQDYNTDTVPNFGEKIPSVGKPPSDHWAQNKHLPNIGKPFTTSQNVDQKPFNSLPNSNKHFHSNYIPHNVGFAKQPVYDIPIRDNSDETTTSHNVQVDQKKEVFENSEEIYDGEDESGNESDGEISQESMKVPVVSTTYTTEKHSSSSSTEITLLQDEVFETQKETKNNISVQDVNSGTQTEKPFDVENYNKTHAFQSNAMKPIYEHNSNAKPRPFTSNPTQPLDNQLHQPHWQINQLVENSTNISYEDNLDLNIGEEISTQGTTKPVTTQKSPHRYQEVDNKYNRVQRPIFSVRNNSSNSNNSNIITSTIQFSDKKKLTISQKEHEKESTLPTFTISSTNYERNKTSSDIIDLAPPPPTVDYNFKPTGKEETIMGMSPPPPRTPMIPPSRPTRPPVTARPLPPRTPPPYRTKPTRSPSPPRTPPQRPTRKPITRDEVSTYRPAFDIKNNIKKPFYNQDEPSSQLLPPPRNIPSRVITPVNEVFQSPTVSPLAPNIIFPTPISSGWLTSSALDFSSSYNFAPTSVLFPKVDTPSNIPDLSTKSVTEYYDSYEKYPSPSTGHIKNELTDKQVTEKLNETSSETSSETSVVNSISSKEDISKELGSSESSKEDSSTDRMKVIPLGNRNRTRKPYPHRQEEKKPANTYKYKAPPKPSVTIKPTRTISRPEVIYPTRQVPIRKRPLPSRTPATIKPSLIESSETFIDDDEYVKPTDAVKDVEKSLNPATETSLVVEKTPKLSDSTILQNENEIIPKVQPTHHAGNEIKIADDVIPTKTEFRTAIVTLTKTLSELPKTVSSIGYINLTHTMTVTKTQTSLISQSEGAVTQTLVLTNTHTSTLVEVVTEIHTQVQPVTIIETVTKHIPVPQVEATPVQEAPSKTKLALDDISMSSEEQENLIIRDGGTTENIQKIDHTDSDTDKDTFFVVMNKSQNGGQSPPPVQTEVEVPDYDNGITRNEQVNSNGVSQVLFGEILLAGTPYLETPNVVNPSGVAYAKECRPDCKASRNERCQRIDGLMKCVCRPGFARMFPDRPCKPTYTYSVKLALGSQGNEKLRFHENLADNSSKEYNALAVATHEGINRMIMQSDLRDVYHGVHITGFQPVEMNEENEEPYHGVVNDFYVQLSDNAHESRLKEVIEKYLRNNNYSLGGTDVYAAAEFMDRLNVSDFNECTSGRFHDCSENARCFNLRGTYTCRCSEGFADLSVNKLYPGRICSSDSVGCAQCNYHGTCYTRDDRRVLCECFQWFAGSTCHINLKVVLIALVTTGAFLTIVLVICAVIACIKRPRPPQRSIVACIQSMPGLHQGAVPSKQRADRRALICERADSGDASSIQNASLPYMPAKKSSSSNGKKMVICDPPGHEAPPPPPAPAVMIPRARLHPAHRDSRDMSSRKQSMEVCSEAKLISYLESGANGSSDEMMRRKHSMESSYSAPKDRHNKQGALVSAGFKVSTTIRPDEQCMKEEVDDMSSITKNDLEAEMARYHMRKSYSQEDMSEWTDAERRIGELTLSEARSVGGTLPASTGRAASSTRLTHQEANTMAERDLGSTFLLPHVHLYKPDITSDVSEFDSL